MKPNFKILALCVVTAAAFAPARSFADAPPPLPQEGFDACTGKREGDACTASFKGMEIRGACAAVGDQGLFCRPNNVPPRSAR